MLRGNNLVSHVTFIFPRTPFIFDEAFVNAASPTLKSDLD